MARLADPLRGRDNALNFLRLVLAIAVIVDHSVPLSGLSSPRRGPLSDVAVDGFFVLSGYLVSGSRVRMSGPRYAWHRALRILPGLWVCLLVTGLVIAPLATLRTHEPWSIQLALRYVAQNATLYSMPDTMGHTLAHVPLPGAWNGSLWTLWFESLGYLAAGLLLWPSFVRRHAAPILVSVAVAAALVVYLAHGPLFVTTNHYREAPTRLACFFAAGMALWALRDRLPSSGRLALVALAIGVPLYVAGALDTGPHPHVATWVPGGLTWMYVLLPLPLGYLLLWLGGVLPVRLGVRNDISYGVYIYAWPMQQLLAVLGGQRLGLTAFTLLAVAITVPMAWLSWTLVEKRVLRLKDLGRTPAPVAG
ncbi:acyltransferase [Allobranchiibius sp. CTAmp26]|uniref:acyltransferase family protein n=1 Tax=Allobranchiibius sp. CTAmp26 TaxID=2815214 RepID=UPI001AA15A1B|nr:acyltransferase [Allobranchiibius sp. CTAmp26]MBO1756224.1 acyltransferase [Allobranchiibius sp. CTAmp26]